MFMKIFRSKLVLLIVVELIVFIALVYWYTTYNTYTITESVITNPDNGEEKKVLYRLNKRTGEVWELGTNIPVKLKEEP